MAALTAHARRQTRNGSARSSLGNHLIETGSVIFDGAIVTRTATGTIKPATNAAAEYFYGMVVLDKPENPPAADPAAGITGDGVKKVEVVSDISVLIALEAGLTVADEGKAMYAQDDNTAGTTTTNGPEIGMLEEFIAVTGSWVALGKKALAVSP